MPAYHNLGDHLLCDVLRVAHRVLLLLVQLADLLVNLSPDGLDVLPLDLGEKTRVLVLLSMRVHLVRSVPCLFRSVLRLRRTCRMLRRRVPPRLVCIDFRV